MLSVVWMMHNAYALIHPDLCIYLLQLKSLLMRPFDAVRQVPGLF